MKRTVNVVRVIRGGSPCSHEGKVDKKAPQKARGKTRRIQKAVPKEMETKRGRSEMDIQFEVRKEAR